MRLGKYPCVLSTGSKVSEAYGTQMISERHRHRYEYNNIFRAPMQTAGLISCGTSPDGSLVEVIELVNHPWFVGCQFHPEFKSRPDQAHPLFLGFVKAAIESSR